MSRRKGRGKRPSTPRERSTSTAAAPPAAMSDRDASPPREAREDPPRGRPRLRPLLALFVIQATLLAIFYGLARFGAPAPRLRALDRVARAGERFTVRATWDQDVPPFLSTMRRGHEIEFRWADPDPESPGGEGTATPAGTAASAATDLNGFVLAEAQAPDVPGVHQLVARPTESPHDPALEARFEVLVLGDRPLAIAVVPGTLASSENGAVGLDAPLPGALATMARLASSGHQPVYLARHATRDSAPMRRWLDENGFPRGPLLFPELIEGAAAGRSHGGPIGPVAEKLRGLGARVAFVFVSNLDDALALESSGGRVFCIHPSPCGTIAGVESVPDWSEASRRLP